MRNSRSRASITAFSQSDKRFALPLGSPGEIEVKRAWTTLRVLLVLRELLEQTEERVLLGGSVVTTSGGCMRTARL